MANELRLTGFDELLAELATLAPDLAAEAAPLQARIADETADNLREALPVVTGRLVQSVAVAPVASPSSLVVMRAVTVGAPYAPMVEFGTRYVSARPRFVPITRRGREQFVREVVEAVREKGLRVTGDA